MTAAVGSRIVAANIHDGRQQLPHQRDVLERLRHDFQQARCCLQRVLSWITACPFASSVK